MQKFIDGWVSPHNHLYYSTLETLQKQVGSFKEWEKVMDLLDAEEEADQLDYASRDLQ